MKASSQWIRRAILWSATGAATAAMIVAASSAQAAHTTRTAGTSRSSSDVDKRGPGYPAPGGIYKPFTNCPLFAGLMQESLGGNATGCVAGDVLTGTFKIGNITTTVTHPVTVQFGIWDPPNATPDQFTGGILAPRGGLAAQLVTSADNLPGGLLKALGCPSSKAKVQKLCNEAKRRGGKYLKVSALAQSAGPITNFQLTTWTQPLKFKLINPLLGSYCYIGSDNNPIVLNPSLTGTLVEENDPHPKLHPDTAVLKIKDSTATDTTFTAPGVTGCGPGGSANITIDEAIDTAAGLPSATGLNSATLNGTFYLAACYAPHNMAKILLSAFRASAKAKATQAAGHRITFASLRHGRYGFRLRR
jgi:hypothetical protein